MSIIEFYGIELPVGSYVQHYAEDGTVDGYGFVKSGTVDVTREKGVYTFALHLEMAGGSSLEATHTWEITITEEQLSAPFQTDLARATLSSNNTITQIIHARLQRWDIAATDNMFGLRTGAESIALYTGPCFTVKNRNSATDGINPWDFHTGTQEAG